MLLLDSKNRQTEIVEGNTKIPVFVFVNEGWTTTCIVITPPPAPPLPNPPGRSLNGVLHCAIVWLFSKIFPELISFRSVDPFGVIFVSASKFQSIKIRKIDDDAHSWIN